jgi:hypothetical protein
MYRSTGALALSFVMTALLIATGLTAAPDAADADQHKLQLAYTKARATVDALLNRDYQTVVDLTYPKVVELMGGPSREIVFIRDSMKQSESEGIALKQCHVERPTKLAGGDGHLFAVVPETLVLSVPDGTMTQQSYLLAISDDDGKSWTFIDGGSTSPQRIKQLIPNLPDDLKLPEEHKSVHDTMLTSKDGHLELKLPDGWEKQETKSPVVQIEAYNEATGATLVVSSAEKADYTDFPKYASGLKKGAQGSLRHAHSTGPKEERLGGHRTIRYDVTGTSEDGLRLGFVVTAVESRTRFNAVFISCVLSKFNAHKDEFARLPGGLEEVAARAGNIGPDTKPATPGE